MPPPDVLRCSVPGDDMKLAKEYELSDMDTTKLPVLFPLYLVFRYEGQTPELRQSTVNEMKAALDRTLADFPLMLGKVFKRPNVRRRHVRRSLPEDGDILFVTGVSQLRMDVPSFEDLALTKFVPSNFDPEKLFPSPERRLMTSDEGGPACLFQITFIRGGIILSCAFNHIMNDASSYEMFLNAWSAHSNNKLPAPPTPLLDRSILNCNERAGPEELRELDAFVSKVGSAHMGFWPPRPVPNPLTLSVASLSISLHEAEAAKAMLTPSLSVNVSSSDCLIALIWRAITRSRLPMYDLSTSSLERTELEIAVNFRGRSKFDFPNNYFGNAVCTTSHGLSIASLLREDAWPEIAAAVRTAVDTVDQTAVEKMIKWSANVSENPRRVAAGPQPPNLNILTSSWNFIDCYNKVDFGFGPCESLSMGTPPVECMVILPRRNGPAGRWEALLSLEKGCLGRLSEDKELSKYMMVSAL